MERGIVRKRMEGWYADAVSSTPESTGHVNGASNGTASKGDHSDHNKMVDFSPVFQALQAKLASLTHENITLRETVKELEEAMGAVEEQYQQRLKEALAHVSTDRREHVRNVIQSMRIRERQERAMYKHLTGEKLHDQVKQLERELRSTKQEAMATEGVFTMAIDKLKKEKAELQVRFVCVCVCACACVCVCVYAYMPR